ncbi:hypothetical protein A3SI_11459 [Nitritalea halalkaliphila LW7]|uniref:Cell division protein FtsL n=1 Tax=Nitritalea halalkaliphila LW7 TaxID=1189621 RepID=I5C2D1_9BACT|nr:FtsL-like putative cell division protein [Nitritalea halalkaliphila]EIM75983.1 hypothetical protein A3SI_11459 [Nitritalea halalkaliphila LW7]
MANTFRKSNPTKPQAGKQKPKKAGKSLFGWLESTFNVRPLLGDGIPAGLVLPFLFFALLAFLYIYTNYRAENLVREIARLQTQVDNLRVDVTTEEANYLLHLKQSELAKRLEPLGLVEISQPPIKLERKQKAD